MTQNVEDWIAQQVEKHGRMTLDEDTLISILTLSSEIGINGRKFNGKSIHEIFHEDELYKKHLQKKLDGICVSTKTVPIGMIHQGLTVKRESNGDLVVVNMKDYLSNKSDSECAELLELLSLPKPFEAVSYGNRMWTRSSISISNKKVNYSLLFLTEVEVCKSPFGEYTAVVSGMYHRILKVYRDGKEIVPEYLTYDNNVDKCAEYLHANLERFKTDLQKGLKIGKYTWFYASPFQNLYLTEKLPYVPVGKRSDVYYIHRDNNSYKALKSYNEGRILSNYTELNIVKNVTDELKTSIQTWLDNEYKTTYDRTCSYDTMIELTNQMIVFVNVDSARNLESFDSLVKDRRSSTGRLSAGDDLLVNDKTINKMFHSFKVSCAGLCWNIASRGDIEVKIEGDLAIVHQYLNGKHIDMRPKIKQDIVQSFEGIEGGYEDLEDIMKESVCIIREQLDLYSPIEDCIDQLYDNKYVWIIDHDLTGLARGKDTRRIVCRMSDPITKLINIDNYPNDFRIHFTQNDPNKYLYWVVCESDIYGKQFKYNGLFGDYMNTATDEECAEVLEKLKLPELARVQRLKKEQDQVSVISTTSTKLCYGVICANDKQINGNVGLKYKQIEQLHVYYYETKPIPGYPFAVYQMGDNDDNPSRKTMEVILRQWGEPVEFYM